MMVLLQALPMMLRSGSLIRRASIPVQWLRLSWIGWALVISKQGQRLINTASQGKSPCFGNVAQQQQRASVHVEPDIQPTSESSSGIDSAK